MPTHELMAQLAKLLLLATRTHMTKGKAAAEIQLRVIQNFWNRERPLTLHTMN